MAEIYGLFDPDSGELRYIGKAKCSAKRIQSHIRESRGGTRPVHNWFRKLLASRKVPTIKVLEIADNWQEAETRLIAHYRKSCDLLNVADGGDRPGQTKEQRVKAAKAANKVIAQTPPALKAFYSAKRDLARFASDSIRRGDVFGGWCLRLGAMAKFAKAKPHLYSEWLQYVRT